MRALRLLGHQFKFEQLRFWRDPAGLFYALAFPLLMLVIFGAVLARTEENGWIGGREVDNSVYYFAAVLTMGVVAVNMVNLSVALTAARERGVLKRVRVTPLPTWLFLAGRIATSVFVTAALVVVTSLAATSFYDVPLRLEALPAALLALVLGTACFAALGMALTVLTSSEGAAGALTNLVAFPLFFISGLWVRNDILPAGMQRAADLLPVKHLFAALALAFDASGAGPAVRFWDPLVLMLWAAAGVLVFLLAFRWSPVRG